MLPESILTTFIFQDEEVNIENGNYYKDKKLFDCKPYYGYAIEESKVLIDDSPNSGVGRQKSTCKDKSNLKTFSEAVKQDNQIFRSESGKIHSSNMLLLYCLVFITL